MGLFIFPKRQTGYNGWPLQSEVSRILKGVFTLQIVTLAPGTVGDYLCLKTTLKQQLWDTGMGCGELSTSTFDRMAGRP